MFSHRRQFIFASVICTVLILAIAACSPAAQPTPTPTALPQQTVLLVSGSGTTTSVLAALQPDFEAAQPDYALQILPGSGTGGGITGVMDGTLDLAAMARAPKEDETAEGLQFVSFGQAGVGIIVHPEVNVTNLTQEQLNDIFFGRITNWEEVGGQDLPIVVFVRDEGDTATGALRSGVFGDTEFPESTAAVLTSARDMMTSVEGTVGAIGFGTWPGIKAAETSAKSVTINDFTPEDADYPYVTELGVGYVEGRAAVLKPFIDWIASEAGQQALGDLGLILS